jgi:hypothetical protein
MLRYLHKDRKSEKYVFSIHTSLSKAKLCFELLKAIDCNNVVYKHIEDFSSAVNRVYFEPSETISKVMEKVKAIREKLENNETVEPYKINVKSQ